MSRAKRPFRTPINDVIFCTIFWPFLDLFCTFFLIFLSDFCAPSGVQIALACTRRIFHWKPSYFSRNRPVWISGSRLWRSGLSQERFRDASERFYVAFGRFCKIRVSPARELYFRRPGVLRDLWEPPAEFQKPHFHWYIRGFPEVVKIIRIPWNSCFCHRFYLILKTRPKTSWNTLFWRPRNPPETVQIAQRRSSVPHHCFLRMHLGALWDVWGTFLMTFLTFFHAFSPARFHYYLHAFWAFSSILAPFLTFFGTSPGTFLGSFWGPRFWRVFPNWVNASRFFRISFRWSFSYTFLEILGTFQKPS